MQKEIDLRVYLRTLINAWKILLAVTILAFGLALTYSLTRPLVYTASTVLTIEPSLFSSHLVYSPQSGTTQFSGQLTANDKTAPNNKILLELANSDLVHHRAYEAWGGNDLSYTDFKSLLEAKTGNDLSLLILSGSARNADIVVAVVQAWVQALQEEANTLFNPTTAAQLEEWNARLDAAQIELDAAEQSWQTFQAQNRSSMIQNELQTLLTAHQACQDLRAAAQLVLDDLETMGTILQDLPDTSPAISGLTQITLLVVAPNEVSPTMEVTLPMPAYQLQTIGEQRATLNAWIAIFTSRQSNCDKVTAILETQILSMQQTYQQTLNEEERAKGRFLLARETYNILLAKTQEVALAQGSSDVLAVLRPGISASPEDRTVLNLLPVAAGLAAFLLVALVIIVRAWWRESNI